MRKSTHYELNLVEGNDIVNPMVNDVPNFERIDEVMFENSNSGITVATELLSGTVHAITRENPNCGVFRFVATANFETGDTFTVDGVQVTALMTNGTPVVGGAYVINANVMGCLVGTMLTLFVAQGGDLVASDSAKLGGKDAEYYAPASAVVEATNVAQSANTISLNNQQSISQLSGQLGNLKLVAISEANFETLAEKDNSTLYFTFAE